ncbi:hypothetical protein GCM10009639_22680 [Kitasatospora putterlickiae]|uniref:Secreted protein n=1 Tax=Kitasatospora putterlickiae TaxID=221725 RepID=A0ABN1XWU9_9ACTN
MTFAGVASMVMLDLVCSAMEWPSASSLLLVRPSPLDRVRPEQAIAPGDPSPPSVRPGTGPGGPRGAGPAATGRSPPGCRRVPFERPGPDLVGRVKV